MGVKFTSKAARDEYLASLKRPPAIVPSGENMNDISKEKYDEFWDGLDPQKVQEQAEKRAKVKEWIHNSDFGAEVPDGVNPKLPEFSDQFEQNEPGIIEDGDWSWVLELWLDPDWDEGARNKFFDDIVEYVYEKYDGVLAAAHRERLVDDDVE